MPKVLISVIPVHSDDYRRLFHWLLLLLVCQTYGRNRKMKDQKGED